MKIRSDFVTNSSSSSYVIAYRDLDAPHPSILNKMIEIVLFSDSGYETTRGEKVATIDELNSYMVDTYGGYGDLNTIDKLLAADNYAKKIHTECVKALNDGYTVLFKAKINKVILVCPTLRAQIHGNPPCAVYEMGEQVGEHCKNQAGNEKRFY